MPLYDLSTKAAWVDGRRMEVVGAFCVGTGVTPGGNCTDADDWQLELREVGGVQLETYTVRTQVCVTSPAHVFR